MCLRRRVAKIECFNSNETTLEVDSHADTTCLGAGALKLFDFNCPVRVQGYGESLGTREFQTISGAVAFVHPYTGRRYHLVVHQAIHMPEMDHHLLCPMQCRTNGVKINECPRMFCGDNVTKEDHAMVVLDERGEKVVLPFFFKGVTSYVTVEALSREE